MICAWFIEQHNVFFRNMFQINDTEIILAADTSQLNRSEYRFYVTATDSGHPSRKASVTVTVHFPVVALPATSEESSEYFVLAVVLGGLAGFLLFVVLILVCYVGKT